MLKIDFLQTNFESKRTISLNQWVLLIVGYLILNIIISNVVMHGEPIPIASILNSLIFLFTFILIFKKFGVDFKNTWNMWKKSFNRDFALCFLVSIILVPLELLMVHFNLTGTLLKHHSVEMTNALNELISKTNYLGLFLWFFSLGILTPIVEEIFFRRLLYVALRHQYNFKRSIVFGSLIFALFHPGALLLTFITSFVCYYLYERFQRLSLTIFLHSFNNLVILSISIYRLS
ncbi:MAG: CPBP family intramembrane metalloprotease [Elusimicrobia bacterium]|nr:CPBP family intramembrane metalloprotease [Elusimicrobiota bacterium]